MNTNKTRIDLQNTLVVRHFNIDLPKILLLPYLSSGKHGNNSYN